MHGILILAAALLQPTGEIRLSVTDPSGAAMEASGELEGHPFQTDARGRYSFTSLPFGRYHLEVSKDGFATQSVLIDVSSDAPIVRTITLALSTPTVKVEVVETTPLPGVNL